jgi:hypothetical protein
MTMSDEDLDQDLVQMTRDELVAEIVKLRVAVREHRDSSAHALCWYHPALWSTLPEQQAGDVAVPPWPQFMRGCVAFRTSLDRQLPDAPVWPHEFDEPPVPEG